MAEFQLSVEEVAFAMGVIGDPAVSSGFLLAILGDISQQELEGRLYAASHSLMARGLFDVNLDTQEQQLDQALGAMIRALLANTYSLRCSRTIQGEEQLLNYFLGDGQIVEHRLYKGVVSHLETIPDMVTVYSRCAAFYDLPIEMTAAEGAEEPVGFLPASLLEDVKDAIPTITASQIVAQFTEAGLSEQAAVDLADDLLQQRYRGSVLRAETTTGEITSDRGFLLLNGPQRLWLMEAILEEPPLVRVYRGTPGKFKNLLRSLSA
jgi:hypothetical protein